MRPTLDYVKEKFNEYNLKIFGGRLPEVPVTLCGVSSFVAQYKSQIRTLPDGRREHYNHLLRFSTAFDLPEKELEDTVIHEMIHYFIALHGLGDRTAHGPLFKAMMQSINETHGRNISISHRTSHSEMTAARCAGKKWHVIAILHFTSGVTGVKVLPRVIPKIIDYYNGVTASGNICSVELFLHNDPFFNRFPTSTGRRCQSITEADATEHLRGAHRLEVKGSKLVQK